ncbi:hypothetical protein GUITHDRAFT_114359 [Guillardia theta CCMP2712]|uniref:Ubiquinone biosynthesis protein COQ4 homolog, mitochondrial n=1 Tax=Guillardia theta (strain CCMP2712) TaxID=905079 RepID=L1IU37_GUITC|nr:hypothetical protein GUITHDRAFT_114359 [Guillardia theta CCMP2712]EKX39632.1 hypothetical protein GUITHDRAFT_114359 [Guillardia theta CCMP2712]|eukprot:XP_005826612.1 hypothetical protein GUITHDRAFT_114359 [Guillardia theta CCMP2712]
MFTQQAAWGEGSFPIAVVKMHVCYVRVTCKTGQTHGWDQHIPTSLWEKMFIASSSAVGALRNPERADLVAALGDTTGVPALRNIRRRMLSDESGRQILKEKPILRDFVELEKMGSYKEGSLGRAYFEFMSSRGFSPQERPCVRFVDDPELAYIMLRYREVHDFVHVLTGLGTSVEGEIVQKWFELLQTGLPVCLLSATVGPLRISVSDRVRLATEWVPWALRASVQVPFFMNLYYEKLLDRDIENLRRELDVPPLPHGAP